MDERTRTADAALLKPGVYVGLDSANVVARITITAAGKVTIERAGREMIRDDADKHLWYILHVRNNPAPEP